MKWFSSSQQLNNEREIKRKSSEYYYCKLFLCTFPGVDFWPSFYFAPRNHSTLHHDNSSNAPQHQTESCTIDSCLPVYRMPCAMRSNVQTLNTREENNKFHFDGRTSKEPEKEMRSYGGHSAQKNSKQTNGDLFVHSKQRNRRDVSSRYRSRCKLYARHWVGTVDINGEKQKHGRRASNESAKPRISIWMMALLYVCMCECLASSWLQLRQS